jgi:hypothetical protein
MTWFLNALPYCLPVAALLGIAGGWITSYKQRTKYRKDGF